MADQEKDDFTAQAAEQRSGLASEFVGLLKDNKKWWLAPIIVTIVVLGLLVVLGGNVQVAERHVSAVRGRHVLWVRGGVVYRVRGGNVQQGGGSEQLYRL